MLSITNGDMGPTKVVKQTLGIVWSLWTPLRIWKNSPLELVH